MFGPWPGTNFTIQKSEKGDALSPRRPWTGEDTKKVTTEANKGACLTAPPADKRNDVAIINGNYQYNALHHGYASQKFWHKNRYDASLALMELFPGANVLDVGCGSGVFSDMMARENVTVTGIDANTEAVKFAQANFTSPQITFVNKSLDELHFPASSFDRISLLEVIEHVHYHQGEQLLKTFRELIRPDGRVTISTPNYMKGSPWRLIEKGIDMVGVAPVLEDEQHVIRYTPKKLSELCRANGFEHVATRCMFLFSPWMAHINETAATILHRIEKHLPDSVKCLFVSSFKPM